jgi:Fructose-1,6-bisphosphatase
MRLILSVIKADVGSVGGHAQPSARMMATVMGGAAKAIDNGLVIDSFVCHTGDDIAIVRTHTRAEGNSEVHQFAWNTFLAATSVAKISGPYGSGMTANGVTSYKSLVEHNASKFMQHEFCNSVGPCSNVMIPSAASFAILFSRPQRPAHRGCTARAEQ